MDQLTQYRQAISAALTASAMHGAMSPESGMACTQSARARRAALDVLPADVVNAVAAEMLDAPEITEHLG